MHPLRLACLLVGAWSLGCDVAAGSPATAPARSNPAVPADDEHHPHPTRYQPARPSGVGDPLDTRPVTRIRITAAIDGGPATDGPAYARADQGVTLYAVLETADGQRYSDAPALRLGGRAVTAAPLAAGPRIELAWRRIEPVAATYSNGDGPTFHYEPIEYRATAIDGAEGGALVPDVRPTLTPDHGRGVGTMRYQLVVRQGARTVETAGIEARRGGASGGLTDAVMRVSVRRDDTYLGYLTEMFGQPYVWASAGRNDPTHQSERLEGSDCADFIVYAARRLGARMPYSWTGALPGVTRKLGGGTRGEDGVYRDARGTPVPFTRAGDLVLFPRHVGALTVDRGTPGVLDDQDLMMHTLFDSPKEQAIADSGYAGTPVEVRRFKVALPARPPR